MGDIRDSTESATTDAGAPAPSDTGTLIQRIRVGDLSARDELFRRYLPLLRRWAGGRIPPRARNHVDTDDIVQVTLMRTLSRLDRFEMRHHGSLLAYLRQVFLNEVRHKLRCAKGTPEHEEINDEICDDDMPTMLEQIIGREQLRAYQQALGRLTKKQQEVLVMRIEFGMTYPEIALETGRSADAVRIMATRATAELGQLLGAYIGQDN